jgi:cytochrome c oxidase subunit 1
LQRFGERFFNLQVNIICLGIFSSIYNWWTHRNSSGKQQLRCALHDTYYVVGIFIRIINGSSFALFAGYYQWVRQIQDLVHDEFFAQLHFWVTFLGVNLTFFPMHFLGLSGMPRRIPDFNGVSYGVLNSIISFGSTISIINSVGLFLFLLFIAKEVKSSKNSSLV